VDVANEDREEGESADSVELPTAARRYF